MGWSNVGAAIIEATIVIVTGSANSGIFIYSPSPGAGNLVGVWAAQSGTDPYGNTYSGGLTIQNSMGHLFLSPGAGSPPVLEMDANTPGSLASVAVSQGVGSVSQLNMSSGDYINSRSSNANTFLNLNENSWFGGFVLEPSLNVDGGSFNAAPTNAQVQYWTAGTVNNTLAVLQSSTTTSQFLYYASDTTWTAMTLAGSWGNAGSPAGNAKYRRSPEGFVQFSGDISWGDGVTAPPVTITTLPTGYRPNRQVTLNCQYNPAAAGTQPIGMSITVSTAGVVQLTNYPAASGPFSPLSLENLQFALTA